MSVADEQLDSWRGRLNASGLPVFSRTVREIRNVSTSRRSSAQDLSDVIGHDASMAARVIQIANSPLFNLQNRDIDTINAAVVLVGFDAVRDLVISVSVIEEMLKGRQHVRVGQYMARAFHAAAQARSFAKACGDKTEEVFVGALLKQVGAMAFWSRAEREAIAVEAEMEKGLGHEEAEKRVLGFELSQLSQVLADDWNLGDLVTHVLDGHHSDDRLVQHIQFGHELAEVLETHAWDSKEVAEVVGRLAKHLNLKPRQVEEMVRDNLDAAVAIAERFGVTELEDTLPELSPRADQTKAPAEDADCQSQVEATQYDALRLLEVIGAIADSIEQGANRDQLMQSVVDGVHQALGFAHAYFALFSPDRTKLIMKYVSGAAARGASCDPERNELFGRALQDSTAVVFDQSQIDAPWHLGGGGAVVAVRLAGKTIGVMYGELSTDEVLADDQLTGFKQLGQQIALILAQVKS